MHAYASIESSKITEFCASGSKTVRENIFFNMPPFVDVPFRYAILLSG